MSRTWSQRGLLLLFFHRKFQTFTKISQQTHATYHQHFRWTLISQWIYTKKERQGQNYWKHWPVREISFRVFKKCRIKDKKQHSNDCKSLFCLRQYTWDQQLNLNSIKELLTNFIRCEWILPKSLQEFVDSASSRHFSTYIKLEQTEQLYVDAKQLQSDMYIEIELAVDKPNEFSKDNLPIQHAL